MTVKRTQFGNVTKLEEKCLGPNVITVANNNDRYEVEKIGDKEGQGKTSNGFLYMKPRPMD